MSGAKAVDESLFQHGGQSFNGSPWTTTIGDKLPDGENRSPSGVGQFSATHETFQE
jgi:hypothetical protein